MRLCDCVYMIKMFGNQSAVAEGARLLHPIVLSRGP